MLRTAADAVARTGITVSLEHIRLEDVIREAGVSRSTAYRRWPNKDQFLGDLLLELARGQEPRQSTGADAALGLVRALFAVRIDWLRTSEGRRRLLVEVVRETAAQDFRQIYESGHWRTYLALTSTAASLPAGELRDQVRQALATSEQALVDGVAASTRAVADLLGLRLRDPRVSFETLAQLTNAMMRGHIAKALVEPEFADERIGGDILDAEGDWTLPGLGLVGIVTTYVEPDPDVVWDEARIDRIREQVS